MKRYKHTEHQLHKIGKETPQWQTIVETLNTQKINKKSTRLHLRIDVVY